MTKTITIAEWLASAQARLRATSEFPALETQALLAHCLGTSRAHVLTHPEQELTAEQSQRLEALLSRLLKGEPLPYVLGQQEFFGLTFYVASDVLIPRPETELLVERALRWLQAHPQCRRGIDVGTGSGCIAAALAFHVSDLQLIASDISWPALQIARRNVQSLGLEARIRLVQADLLQPFGETFDLICANLPYIPSSRLAHLAVSRYEPQVALDGGEKGLDLITQLLEQARSRLGSPGLLLLEIDHTHGSECYQLTRKLFPDATSEILEDLGGQPRLLCIER